MEKKPRQSSQRQGKPAGRKFISVYRVTLVKDRRVSFNRRQLNNSAQAQPLIRKLIKTQGQPDREQFCVVLLNAKNEIIGLNIVSTGDLLSATVHPREVLKPAILANATAMVLCHPSEVLSPSEEDIAITERIIRASKVIGIFVHEHLIISTQSDRYYSFADNGLISQIYNEIK